MKSIPFKFMLIFLFVFGVIFQLAVISPSGNLKNDDLLFWSSHAHDSMWHIAVSNEIQKGFPLDNPVFAGERLVNYHIFSDILPAVLNKVFKIPDLFLYFWFMPIIYSILLGLTAYLAGKEIGKTKLSGLFSVFAVYFIGSFGWVVTLFKKGEIGGESLFWATQVQSSIGNPPQILSNILVLAFIYFLARYLKGSFLKKKIGLHQILLAILLTSLTLSKIYAGMVILPAVGFLALYRAVKLKSWDILITTIISLFLILLLYLPFTKAAGNYLIFEPFWFARRLFSDEGRVGIKNFELIFQYYQSLNSLKSKLGFARYDLLGLSLILFGNLGVRSLGFLAIPKTLKREFQIGIFLFSTAFLSYLIPNLFLQKGVATNTSQTFQYMLLVFGIYFAISLSDIFSKIKSFPLKLAIISIVLLLSIPTQIGLLHQFYSRPAYTKITGAEIEALNYLKNSSDETAVILTPPYNQYLDTKEIPPPVWDWFDTSYVSALSKRRTYFDDYEQVDIMGYDFKSRQDSQKKIFEEKDQNLIDKLLRESGVNYIYYPKLLAPKADLAALGLKQVFDNSEVKIWKVNSKQN